MKYFKIILVVIVAIGLLIRIYNLSSVPPSLDWDEVSLGYNAYSILHTGKDEYGTFLPVLLKSFGDYKPALYAYLTIPFVAIFGLTPFAVRLPSVLFGVISIIVSCFIAIELVGNKKKGNSYPFVLGLITAGLVSLSPWHIQFSRVAFEANIGLSLLLISILFFLKSLKKHFFIIFSFLIASLNLYAYQSEKFITPATLLLLLILYWKEVVRFKKNILLAAVGISAIILIPLVIVSLSNHEVFSRAKNVSVFSQNVRDEYLYRINQANKTNVLVDKIVENKFYFYSQQIVQNYLSHFDFNWLFIKGDFVNSRHHAPFMGLLYLFELPLLLIGIWVCFFNRNEQIDIRTKLFILVMILIVPIPSAFSIDAPHAVRTIHFIPFLQLLTGMGIIALFYKLKDMNVILRYFLSIAILTLMVLNILYYFNQYFIQLSYYDSKEWQYGYKETIAFIKPIQSNYKNIYVSDNTPLDQSYIFFLFYLQYDPLQYQQSGGSSNNPKKFANFIFTRDMPRDNEKALYVTLPSEVPTNTHILHEIYYLNNTKAIVIAENK